MQSTLPTKWKFIFNAVRCSSFMKVRNSFINSRLWSYRANGRNGKALRWQVNTKLYSQLRNLLVSIINVVPLFWWLVWVKFRYILLVDFISNNHLAFSLYLFYHAETDSYTYKGRKLFVCTLNKMFHKFSNEFKI